MPVQIIGGDPTQIEMIAGLQGLVSDSTAAMQEMRTTAAEMLTLAQRTASLYGDAKAAAAQTMEVDHGALTNTITESIKKATESVVRSAEERAQRAAHAPPVAPQQSPAGQQVPAPAPQQPAAQNPQMGPWERSPASVGQTESTAQMRAEARVAAEPVLDPYEEFQQGRNMSIGEMRQRVAGSVSERLQDFQFGPQLEQVNGQWVDRADAAAGLAQAVGPDRVADFLRNQALLSGGKKILTDVAGGRKVGASVLGRLPAGAARFAGPVGMAVGAATLGSNFLENQRSTNAAWQRTLGGSNVEGLAERGRSRAFQATQVGTLGQDQAEQLYQGAADIYGTDRVARDEAMDFAIEQYKRLGIEVGDSIEMIANRARAGQRDLAGLGEALEGVSQAAREAGTSAEVGRRMFGTASQGMAQMGVTGPQADAISQAMTQASLASFGASAENMDMTGMLQDPTNLRRMASMLGFEDLGSFTAELEGPGGAEMMTRGAQALVAERVPGGQRALEPIRQYMAAEGIVAGQTDPTDAQRQEINRVASRSFRDPEMAQRILQELGITGVALTEAPGVLAQMSSGIWNPGAEEARRQEEMAGRSTEDILRETVGGADEEFAGIAGMLPDWMTKEGPMGAAFRGLNKVFGTGGGGGGMPDWKVKVQDRTEDGRMEERVVSLADATKHYEDQVRSGEAVVVEGTGENEGRTLGDITGMSGPSAGAPGKRVGKGQAAQDFENKRKDEGGRDGKVMVGVQPPFDRIFTLFTQGSAYTEDRARHEGRQPERLPPAWRNQPGN